MIKRIDTATKPAVYPTWDSDLQTWLNAHNAPLLDYQKNAINSFIIGLKADGLWNKIGAFYILKRVMPNDNTNYWKYNLKNPNQYTLSFTCNNATVDRLWKRVTTSEQYYLYASTGYIFTSGQRNNKHLMIFTNAVLEVPVIINAAYTSEIKQTSVANGVLDSIGTRSSIAFPGDIDKFRLSLSDNNNINIEFTAPGFHCGSRLNANAVSAVRNGVIVMDEVASASVAAENGQEIIIGGTYTEDYVSMGDGLTQAEMLLYNTRVSALDVAFYNMELEADYYGNDKTFLLAKMRTYNSADVDIKRLEINNVPLYLLGQRNSIKVAVPTFGGDDFYVSVDCGVNWTRKRWIYDNLHYASNVVFMYIFDDGSIIFATKYNKLWKTTDYFTTVTEIVLQNIDGSPYVYHTPISASYPGNYFRIWNIAPPMYVNSSEILVWGNWCNYDFGASPVNVYYYDGTNVKVVYTFGQYWRDNGTAAGSGTTGNLLGDAGNPIAVLHVHCVTQNPDDNSFWVATGEDGANARWMKGVYDDDLDTWTWTSEAQGDVAGPGVRCGAFWWRDGYIYFVSDAYQSGHSGIWKLPEADIGLDINTHGTLIHPIPLDSGPTMISGNEIICSRVGGATDRSIYYSKNSGVQWYKIIPYVLAYNVKPGRWFYKDTNGYFAFGNSFLMKVDI